MYDTGNDGNHRNVAKVQQFQKLGWSQIPRGSRQVDMLACPLGSLLRENKAAL